VLQLSCLRSRQVCHWADWPCAVGPLSTYLIYYSGCAVINFFPCYSEDEWQDRFTLLKLACIYIILGRTSRKSFKHGYKAYSCRPTCLLFSDSTLLQETAVCCFVSVPIRIRCGLVLPKESGERKWHVQYIIQAHSIWKIFIRCIMSLLV
jgi:hypothetical protein